jgi:hypothetical protein
MYFSQINCNHSIDFIQQFVKKLKDGNSINKLSNINLMYVDKYLID